MKTQEQYNAYHREYRKRNLKKVRAYNRKKQAEYRLKARENKIKKWKQQG